MTIISTEKWTNYNCILCCGRREKNMKLCEAIGLRIGELLEEHHMTRYKLYKNCGLSKSCVNDIANGQYESTLTTNIWIICQGFGISLHDFFDSPLFDYNNLEP